jgi:hypothetical protein
MARDSDREAAWTRRLASAGEWLDNLDRGRGVSGLESGQIRDIRIRLATEDDPGVLLIVRAFDANGAWVAFVGGLDVVTALLTWRSKDSAKGLKWNVDKPWSGRSS